MGSGKQYGGKGVCLGGGAVCGGGAQVKVGLSVMPGDSVLARLVSSRAVMARGGGGRARWDPSMCPEH